MNIRLTVLSVTVATCLALLMPAAASAARDCGSYDGQRWTQGEIQGAGIFNVVGRSVSCRTARRVSLNAFGSYRSGNRWKYGRWSCRIVAQSYEYTKARCTASAGRVVRWETGS